MRVEAHVIRLATLDYVNALPLTGALGQVDPACQVVAGVPSEARGRLLSRTVDAALLPVVDYLDYRDVLEPLADLGICSSGPVYSVYLRRRVPLERVRTIRPDPASRTSNVLAEVLARSVWNIPVPIRWVRDDSPCDAEILIGDRALKARDVGVREDLATWWRTATELPFVFALWVTLRNHEHKTQLEALVRQAYRRSREQIDSLTRQAAARLDRSVGFCRTYLREALTYEIGPREKRAIERFDRWRRGADPRHLHRTVSTNRPGEPHVPLPSTESR